MEFVVLDVEPAAPSQNSRFLLADVQVQISLPFAAHNFTLTAPLLAFPLCDWASVQAHS